MPVSSRPKTNAARVIHVDTDKMRQAFSNAERKKEIAAGLGAKLNTVCSEVFTDYLLSGKFDAAAEWANAQEGREGDDRITVKNIEDLVVAQGLVGDVADGVATDADRAAADELDEPKKGLLERLKGLFS